jgi:hypothetical protein
MAHVEHLRVAAYGGTRAVAADDGRALYVFTSIDGVNWRTRKIASKPHDDWDMAMGPDKKPRVVFSTGSLPRMRIFNGRAVVGTNVPVDETAIAVDDHNRIHIAFALAPRSIPLANSPFVPNNGGEIPNGIYYLKTNGTAHHVLAALPVQSVGTAPPISIAVSRRQVAIAYPGKHGWLYVKTRSR